MRDCTKHEGTEKEKVMNICQKLVNLDKLNPKKCCETVEKGFQPIHVAKL